MNEHLERLSEKRLRDLCLILISFFCLIPSLLFFVPGQSLADSSNGQGFVWFVVLYCAVFYLRKYQKDRLLAFPMRYYVLIVLACMLILVLSKYGLAYISERMGNGGSGSLRFFFNSSLPVALISVCLFLIAMKLPGIKRLTTLISSMASTTLGIYIIHAQPFLNGVMWENVGLMLREHPSQALLLDILVVLLVFFTSMLIEMIRIKLIK